MRGDVLTRLQRRPDPLIDRTPLQRAWGHFKRWAPGIAFVLLLVSLQGKVAEWDEQVAHAETGRELATAKALLASLRDAHRHRAATGCATMFYLVQGDPDDGLLTASMALDSARAKLMAARPIPPRGAN